MRSPRLEDGAGGGEAEAGAYLSFLQTSQVDHLLEGEAGQRPGVSPQGRLSSRRWGVSGPDTTVPKGHVELADSAQRGQEPGGQGGGGKEQSPLALVCPCLVASRPFLWCCEASYHPLHQHAEALSRQLTDPKHRRLSGPLGARHRGKREPQALPQTALAGLCQACGLLLSLRVLSELVAPSSWTQDRFSGTLARAHSFLPPGDSTAQAPTRPMGPGREVVGFELDPRLT